MKSFEIFANLEFKKLMYKFTNQQKYIAILIIIFNPITDIILHISRQLEIGLPLNQVLRIITLGIMMLYLFIVTKRHFTYLILLVLWSLFGLWIYVNMGYSADPKVDLNYIFRVIYCITVFIYVFIILKLEVLTREELLYWLIISGSIVSINILLSPLGLGTRSFPHSHRFGYKGFFDGQNLVTLINLLTIIMVLMLNRKNMYRFLPLYFISAAMIGTRGALLGLFLIVAYRLLLFIPKTKNPKTKKRLIISAIFVLIVGLFSLLVILYYMFNSGSYDSITSMLLSYRNHMLKITEFSFERSMFKNYFILFGMGYSNLSQILINLGLTPTLELDYHAAFYYSGILVFGIILLLTYKSLEGIYNKNRYFRSDSNLLLLLALFLILGLGLINGHVFFETLTSFYTYSVIALCIYKKEI